MKTFHLLLPVALTFLFENVSAQITGQVMSDTGGAVGSANVSVIRAADSSLVSATITDKTGAYRIDNTPAGRYMVRISFVGWKPWQSSPFEITTTSPRKDIGLTVISGGSNELAKVVISGERHLYKQDPGGLIVNVENSLLSKGSSVLQVLERSPGVVVNRRNSNIELNGKAGVLVMLDGKPMPMSMDQLVGFLEGMSADDIEKIELLTTPPASYDADGSGGVINIVRKRNRKHGNSGSISLTGGYGRGEKGSAGVNLAHYSAKVNLSGSYNFSHNSTYSEMFIESNQYMPFLGGQVSVISNDTTRTSRNTHDAAADLSVKVNPKTTLGMNAIFNSNKTVNEVHTDAGYNILPDSLIQFSGKNHGTNHWDNLINSIYLEKLLARDGKLTIDFDYLYFHNKSAYAVQSSFIDKNGQQAGTDEALFSPRQQGFANTLINVGIAKADYSIQLNKNVRIETGVKGAYTWNTSLSGIQSLINGAWTDNDQTSNNITMKEGIGAMHMTFNAQINRSANLIIGGRYEYSYTRMDNVKTSENVVDRRLGAFFPSIFLSKKINDRSTLQLSYSKRISRPSYNDLASYVAYSDPTAVYTGNPFLNPTISNNLKLGYNIDDYAFSLLFGRDNNPIARYQLTESPSKDMLLISPQNLAWQNNITVQATLPWKINEWWMMNYGFVGGLRHYKASYTRQAFEHTYFGYSLNFSQTFKLPQKYSAELSGWYNGTSYNGTTKIKGYGLLNVGIKKEIKNNWGSFQLSVADLLRDERLSIFYGTLTEEAFSIKSHVVVYTESAKFPIIKLTYLRSFGSGNTNKRKISSGSQEETERIQQ